MPQVLTTNAVILCPHGGKGTSIPTDSKWSVNGGIVLLDGDLGTLTCPFILPCTGYQLRSMGLNATVIGARKVMLVTDFTQSFTGFPLTLAETHPAFDNSTPVSIPIGGAPPPTPPELQETDQPFVIVVPGALFFSLSGFNTSSLPTALPMTFTLQSQFPRRWLLSMLNLPTGQHRDITNGEPPNIVVAPSGGAWTSPVLTVNVILTGAFMATLAVGLHHFVLAAVNHRGKSQFAESILTVSP
jgi:hypothetical protein